MSTTAPFFTMFAFAVAPVPEPVMTMDAWV